MYRWPIPVGLDENGPVVDGDPSSAESTDYAACKRGGELAVLEAFGEQALLARAGLILGPYERVGRLPWWLRRLERGGQVLCPGPPDASAPIHRRPGPGRLAPEPPSMVLVAPSTP